MKSFLTWLHESDTPAESAWDLRDQKKKLDKQIQKVVNNFYKNGWSSMSTEEIEEKYPDHKDVKEYRKLNDQLEDLMKKITHNFATGQGFSGDETKGHVFTACLDAKNPFNPQNKDHREMLIPIIKQNVEAKYKDEATGANFNISPTLTNPKTKQPVQTTDDAVDHILWRIENKSWRFVESKPIIDYIKKMGFDSILTQETGANNIAVFDPKQIKILNKKQAVPK